MSDTWDEICAEMEMGLDSIWAGLLLIGMAEDATLQYIKKLITQHGSAEDIDKARDAWTAEGNNSVKSLLTSARNLLVEETQYISTIWSGPAAEAFSVYANGRGGTAGLVTNYTALAECCDLMAEALKALRATLTELFNWLLIAIGAFVAWAVICIMFIFTNMTVLAFFEGTGVFLGAVLVAITQARSTINEIRGTIDNFQDVNTNTAGFPHSKWPRPQLPFDDGSVTDGDASDWRVKG